MEFLKNVRNKSVLTKLLIFSITMFFVDGFLNPSSAMHISEGFLPVKWAGIWYLVALPFVFYGARKMQYVTKNHPKAKILLAMAGAFTFILSALKIPSLTGSCSHPTGIALGAILFGPGPMAIIGLIVLLFQALLLAHGGITTLGANAFSMAIAGAWVAYLVFRGMRKAGLSVNLSVFVAAFLGDLLTYVVTAFQMAIAFPSAEGGVMASLTKFISIFAVTQVPIAVAEAVLSVIIFQIIATYNKEQVIELLECSCQDENKIKADYEGFKTTGVIKKTLILLATLAVIIVAPLYLVKDAEFGGADGVAMDIAAEINPDFEPIFEPFIEPASGEIESMLFALQAAIGAGIIGFGIGRMTKKQ